MRDRILGILTDHATAKIDIAPETKLADLHMDSLELMNTMVSIEGIVDKDVTQEQIAKLVTVADLLALFGV